MLLLYLTWTIKVLLCVHQYTRMCVVKIYEKFDVKCHKNYSTVPAWLGVKYIQVVLCLNTLGFLSTQTDGIYYCVFMRNLFLHSRMLLIWEMVTQMITEGLNTVLGSHTKNTINDILLAPFMDDFVTGLTLIL